MSSKHEFITHLFEEFTRITEVLSEGFVPNYHGEDLRLDTNPKDVMYMGIPMVSFADIEAQTILDHINRVGKDYGSYAISMKKEWALRQKWLNPVWYVTDEATLMHLHRNWKAVMETGISGFMKKYKSPWIDEDFHNYAEREWRYTVPITEVKWILTQEAYDKWRKDSNEKRPAPTEELINHALKFDIGDIDSIIVPDKTYTDEISNFLHTTETFSGQKRKLSEGEINFLLGLVTTIK